MGRVARGDNPYAEDAARLADELRRAREEQGLSREQLAVRARLSTHTLAKIELHATVDPGFFTVARLADELALRLDDLVARASGRAPAARISQPRGGGGR